MKAEHQKEASTQNATGTKKLRTQRGVVVSNKMDKTAVVRIDWRVRHPLYGKIMTRSTRLSVHDETNQCQEGDIVLITEGRPRSKTKSWSLVEVLETAR